MKPEKKLKKIFTQAFLIGLVIGALGAIVYYLFWNLIVL